MEEFEFMPGPSDGQDYAAYPEFGICYLNIPDAAKLIVVDMWFSGGWFDEVPEPEDFNGRPDDASLQTVLAHHFQDFEKKLIHSVDSGKLEAGRIHRDFDEQIIPTETMLDFDALADWLVERGYTYGDIIAEWLDREVTIRSRVADEVAYLRASAVEQEASHLALCSYGAKRGLLEDPDSLRDAIKGLVLENARLRSRISDLGQQQHRPEKRLTTRSRNTFLIIIAALCQKAGLDINARGAPVRIMELTETTGTRVGDDTISAILKDIREDL